MLLCCAVIFLLSSSNALERPSVTTNLGTVKGYHKTSYNGRTYSAFEGIPYAKPPVGKLRFEAPVEPDPWGETLDATKKYVCPQINPIFKNVSGNEDCLYLNVYVPKENPNPSDNFNVIAHIHGGGFTQGSSTIDGPLFFMDRDIIFVNLNYRLGVFGFLSTEDDVVPGNNGLKDQYLALKWIQNYIKEFGGNPNSVTITGPSAGGASVHFHYFSKLSKGLFHRGVSQSGTALSPWALQKGALEKAKALAVLMGCNDTVITQAFIDCLKEHSFEELILQTDNIKSPANGFALSISAPVVEKKSKSAFLDEYPKDLLNSGDFNDLPWITSMCTEEGGIVVFALYKELDTLDENFNKFAEYYMDYNYTACDSDKEDIKQKIREQYFGTDKIGKDTYRTIMQLFGDRLFGLGLEESARIQASVSKSKIYSYIYGYKNSFSDDLIKNAGITDLELGVGHAEDAQLLYDMRFVGDEVINSVLSKEDELIKDMMVDMYISFADGNTPQINGIFLEAVSNSNEFTYLSIRNHTDIKMNVTKELTPTEFWKSLPIIENEKFPAETCK